MKCETPEGEYIGEDPEDILEGMRVRSLGITRFMYRRPGIGWVCFKWSSDEEEWEQQGSCPGLNEYYYLCLTTQDKGIVTAINRKYREDELGEDVMVFGEPNLWASNGDAGNLYGLRHLGNAIFHTLYDFRKVSLVADHTHLDDLDSKTNFHLSTFLASKKE